MTRVLKKELFNSLVINLFVPLGAVALALLIGAIFLKFSNVNPFDAYKSIFFESFGTRYGITETIVKATPLILVGSGICIAFRSGNINIGGEGQMIVGAILSTVVALNLPGFPKYFLLPLVLISGFLGGGIYGFIPGFLKSYLNVNEILSTVMLNAIALQILYLLLRGPLMDPKEIAYGTGYPQSARITESSWLSKLIPGTRLHAGIFIALITAVIVYLLLWKTTIGYRMRAVGKNPVASRYGGINVKVYLTLSMFLAGGLAGLAGAVEVCGIHHRLMDGISAGYGFSGIVAALFGRLHPIGNIPASFFFGALLVGVNMLQRSVNVPGSIVYVIEGLVVIFVVGTEIISRKILAKKVSTTIEKVE